MSKYLTPKMLAVEALQMCDDNLGNVHMCDVDFGKWNNRILIVVKVFAREAHEWSGSSPSFYEIAFHAVRAFSISIQPPYGWQPQHCDQLYPVYLQSADVAEVDDYLSIKFNARRPGSSDSYTPLLAIECGSVERTLLSESILSKACVDWYTSRRSPRWIRPSIHELATTFRRQKDPG